MEVPSEATGDASRILLLGADELRYGQYELRSTPSGDVACCLSVGSDRASPSLEHKGSAEVPNEDAVLVIDAGDRILLAVADAHYGVAASHLVLSHLAATLDRVPASPAALTAALQTIEAIRAPARDRSATTLTVAVLRRDLRAGFGFTIGDSTCAAVGGGLKGRPLHRAARGFLALGRPWRVAARDGVFFDFDLPDDALLFLFTDGVNGCHYGHPITSLGARQFESVLDETGAAPAAFAQRLTEWALAGRRGYPGGQDNLAVAVASAAPRAR